MYSKSIRVAFTELFVDVPDMHFRDVIGKRDKTPMRRWTDDRLDLRCHELLMRREIPLDLET